MNYKTLNLTSLNEKETIYCLGFFDGLHLGHQELIKETKILAKKLNKKVGILTFSTFISTKIEKHNDSKLLMSNDKKNELLKSFDLDVITYLDFDNECKNTSKEDFIKFLKEKLNCVGVVVGEDYRFGYKGEGNINYLLSIKNESFIVKVVPPYKIEGEVVSTTKVIEYLKLGNIEKVNKYLGRNYSLSGKVKEGFHVGKTLEFPTANIEVNNDVIPPLYGVYGVKIHINDKLYYGVANIGIRPSINTLEHPLVETHIFDFNDNIYNQDIMVEFIYFVRNEEKFTSVNELKEQIKFDKEKVLKYINNL